MGQDRKDGELEYVELREGYTSPPKPLATSERTKTTTDRTPGPVTETTKTPVTPDQQRGYVPIPKPQPRPEPKKEG